ncbi:HAMP domain-containing sensor histidine kinase [Clostridium sp. BJN0001]|uniref:HAMP domain-containing sensor histidine kinase n=1 Tax=Clostridium sp. BJN0001 TaxID=2930219 RepID=UPI001FD1D03D|nr:HAMP domain-containing sensor histidine kinase [Clostridium sp. BJN0001]
MNSIRKKLILGIFMILAVFLSGILIYSLTFKYYFKSQRLNEMKHAAKEVNNIISNNIEDDYSNLIYSVANKYNAEIAVEDLSVQKTIFATYKGGKNNRNSNIMSSLNRFEVIETKDIGDNISEKEINDKSTGVKFLAVFYDMKKENYQIVIQVSINSIDESVKKSVKLISLIFLPITIILMVIAIIFADRFTKPIIEITKKTQKITELDFSDPILIKSGDELEILAQSVNNLSEKISSSLDELNKKNKSLIEYIDKEKKNDELKREFVSSVSHELKSPISVIWGYAQMLCKHLIKDEKENDYYLDIIKEESERMQVIVSDLLDLYKLQSKTFKLKFEKVSIDNLIDKIVRKNYLIFNEKKIEVSIDLQKADVFCDVIRIEQVIQNYINNAVSHVDENKKISIKINNQSEYVIVSVFNSGKNIDEKDMDKIWIGFVRSDKVRNYKEKRVGLGLAIVSQIIKLHNGECGVKNISDGVEFFIKLRRI